MRPSSKQRKKAYIATESQIQNAILGWLEANHIFAYRSPNQGMLMNQGGKQFMRKSAQPGLPDITGIMPDGTALYIEVKREDWKPPSHKTLEESLLKSMLLGTKDPYATYRAQREFQRKAALSGALVIIATSCEQVEHIIKQYIFQDSPRSIDEGPNIVYMPFPCP